MTNCWNSQIALYIVTSEKLSAPSGVIWCMGKRTRKSCYIPLILNHFIHWVDYPT